jgi:excisionase family DNA binding protein
MSMTLQVVLTEEQLEEIARRVAEMNGPSRAGAPLTVSAAAAALGVSKPTLYRRITAGEIRTVPDLGRTLVPRSEIERLQEGRPRR